MGIVKRKIWCWVRIRWKKCKKIPKNSYLAENFFHTVIKLKTQFFCHFFINNFFRKSFLANFSMDSNEISINFGLFETHIAFFEVNNVDKISTFYKIWRQPRTKQLKKMEKRFFL